MAGDAELAEPLGRGASTKGQVRAPIVVLMLPSAKLLGELTGIAEDRSAIELVFIGAVAPFQAIAFRAAPGNVAMGDPEIAEMLGEVGAELGATVGLDPLNGRRESAAQFVDEVGRRADRVVRIDPEDTVLRRFVNRGELVEAPAAQLEVLDVHLDRLARHVKLPTPPRPGAVALPDTCGMR